jgi:CRISPR-associated endonuclease Cas1
LNSKIALFEDAASVPERARAHNGLLILTGYGIRVVVEGGHLIVEDGAGSARRRGRFSRATAGLKRLVILGHSGIVSLEALRWLHDIGASFIQIDADGQLINCAGPAGLDDARLRRAQALASDFGTGNVSGIGTGSEPRPGFVIACDLIKRKLFGQWENLKRLRSRSAAEAIASATDRIPSARNIDNLRYIESEAAIAYWEAWRDIDVVFVERDRDRVPEHWLTFGVRRSLLTGNPRNATNPANAILNYLYAILESEARIACLTMGLDPGIGVMHADQRGRDSLACDLMEVVRPAVDAYVLDLLHHRAFKKSDYFETREGICSVMPSVSKHLAETGDMWSRKLAPTTESLARQLSRTGRSSRARGFKFDFQTDLPTPLTQTNRRAARHGYQSPDAGSLRT